MAKVLPVETDTFRSALKVYAQHTQVQVGEDAMIMFCHKMFASQSPDGSEPQEVALPQVVCFMTLPHFLEFARVISEQADRIKTIAPDLVKALENARNANAATKS